MKSFLEKLLNFSTFVIFYKALIPLLFLGLVYFFNFSFLSLLIFLIFLIRFYFTFYNERKNFRFGYWLINILSLIFLYKAKGVFVYVAFLVYFILMFMEIGFFSMLFTNKRIVYYIFSLALYIFFFNILFFLRPELEGVKFLKEVIWMFAIFFGVYFLIKEFWKNLGLGFVQKENIWSWIIALFCLESAYLVSFLPFDFFTAALFLSFILLILRDIYLAYESGSLNMNFIFRQIAIFILFLGLLFFTVVWKVG